MNPIAEEIESYLGSASMTDEEYLAHYGMPRRSGRYPWGSGQDPYQSSRDFLGRVEQMRKSGFTYTDENGKKWTGDNAIAKSLGYNSTDFRTVYAIAKDERRSDMVATAKRLRDKEGMNNSEIGRKMGINESSVRSLLDPNSESRMKQARDTAKQAEYEAIMALTNPTVKKYYLDKFASSCDSAAVHLKAAALPGQKYHVILPVTSLSEKEVYAPGYPDGSKLALVRYPHGGTFEIPICTVNNKNKDAVKMIGKDSIDAIGINSKVAERLSGADFDGDTVMCIPTHDRAGKVKIASRPPLEGLEGFDPKMGYQGEKKTGYLRSYCSYRSDR